MSWLDILRENVKDRGTTTVARELGIARSSLSLVLSGKYPASTKKIKERVIRLYGSGGLVMCPVLGEISPGRCAENFRLSKDIGTKSANPQRLLLFKKCRSCPVRS